MFVNIFKQLLLWNSWANFIMPPHRRCGGYIVLQMSVGRSVCRSVGLSVCLSVGPPNVVRMITQERLVLGSWNFIGSLVMMSRGSLLFLRSVGQRSRSPGHGNIKCCPDDNSRTLGPRIMKLHRELGYDEQRKPIVFEVSRSKVKVTRTWKHKMLSGW